MASVARAAGVSKALVFYHFETKPKFYLFLFDEAVSYLAEQKEAWAIREEVDVFEAVERTIRFRQAMMKAYPSLFQFLTAAYRESHEDVRAELEARRDRLARDATQESLGHLDASRLRDPGEMGTLLRIITLAADGFVRERESELFEDSEGALAEFRVLLDSLERHYLKPELLDEPPSQETP